jgi:hypothetical protein
MKRAQYSMFTPNIQHHSVLNLDQMELNYLYHYFPYSKDHYAHDIDMKYKT